MCLTVRDTLTFVKFNVCTGVATTYIGIVLCTQMLQELLCLMHQKYFCIKIFI